VNKGSHYISSTNHSQVVLYKDIKKMQRKVKSADRLFINQAWAKNHYLLTTKGVKNG